MFGQLRTDLEEDGNHTNIGPRVPRVPFKGTIRVTIRKLERYQIIGVYYFGGPYYNYSIMGPKTLF